MMGAAAVGRLVGEWVGGLVWEGWSLGCWTMGGWAVMHASWWDGLA